MPSLFKRDSRGVREILLDGSLWYPQLHQYADPIAAQVRAQHPDAEVVVDEYSTDRAAMSITVKDPRALLWQARDGLLTRAAAAVGLEVTERA